MVIFKRVNGGTVDDPFRQFIPGVRVGEGLAMVVVVVVEGACLSELFCSVFVSLAVLHVFPILCLVYGRKDYITCNECYFSFSTRGSWRLHALEKPTKCCSCKDKSRNHWKENQSHFVRCFDAPLVKSQFIGRRKYGRMKTVPELTSERDEGMTMVVNSRIGDSDSIWVN